MTRIFAFLMIITMVDPALAQSDRIVLASGKIVHGELAGIVGGYLSIIVQNSSNQAELRYRKDNIERIDFSDSLQRQDAIDRFSSRHPRQSAAMLEELALKRMPYLELLGPEDETVFTKLLESYILSRREEDALERSKLWLQKLPSGNAKLRTEEIQIQAAWKLDRASEAAYYSQRWIESGHSSKKTALPWVSLANAALIVEDYETALWTALNPIVFSPPSRPAYLEDAYAIAIISAINIGDPELAQQLKSELPNQRLSPPANSRWSKLIANAESRLEDDLESEKEASPNQRSVDTVFKLVGKP